MKGTKKIIGIIISVLLVIIIICGAILFIINQTNERNEIDYYKKEDEEQEERERTGSYEITDVGNLPEFLSVEKNVQKNMNKDFKAKRIIFIEKETSVNYAIYGTVGEKEIYYKLIYDTNNETFTLEENKNVKSINEIDLKGTTIDEIKDNGQNKFEFLEMTEEDIARKYLEILTKLEIENPEKAYDMLDEKYKKERFENLNNYKEYIEDHKEMIETGVLAKYSVEYKDDYTEFIMVDTNSNSYKLRAKTAMDFTLLLDNYTIRADGFETSYKQSDNENKVKTNVYIFLQMINNSDYKHAYNLLDKTFKENNFGTLDKFKEYVKKNFLEYNFDTYEANLKEEGKNYIYTTTIRNNSSSATEKKKLTVVMRLKEGTDFVMSFSIEDV